MQPPKILPPHYFVLAVVIIVTLRWLVHGGILGGWLNWLGVLPMAAGLFIAVAASNHFKRVDTNIIPLTRSTTLVTSGMFRYTRNPMYLGMLLFLSGLSVAIDRLEGLVVVAVFFLIIRFRFVIREEHLLAETFGEPYLHYQQQVRRWV